VSELAVHGSITFVAYFVASDHPVTHLTICIASIALLWHSYSKYVGGVKYEVQDLTGHVYIVTGSNTGIGYETVKALLDMNATVIMACRSAEKAKEAKKSLEQETRCSPSKVITLVLDLCELESVRSFVKDFRELHLPLNGLINNAGLMTPNRSTTPKGLETVFTSNHLSHFLLTNLLLPDLEKTNGRVVILTSSLHHLAQRFNFDDMMSEKEYSLFGTYAQSKLANILFMIELQRRLEAKKSSIVCNAVHPGLVLTEFSRHLPFLIRLGDQITYLFQACVRKSPAQGAYTSVHVATAPSLAGGGYYFHCRKAPMSAAARDTEAAEKLWVESEKLVGEICEVK
jgi:NAD(P)-dependent dehydrogenase (short-subunit alcohol dehydrogenase family)